ncbi:MAG: outer membrane lipoprotein carrier protein LolA [Parabacteroides sp.]
MKQLRYTLYYIGIWVGLLLPVGTWAQSAVSILDKAAAAYEQSNGIEAGFTLHSRSAVQPGSESFEGTVEMRGDKFIWRTPDLITWFDGQTQWSYMLHNEEVNVTTPTGEELQMTNPALLLRSYKKGFNAALKGESTASTGKSAYDIELTPKKRSDLTRVSLQIEKLSSLPASIVVEMKNGMTTTIRLTRIRTGVNQPDAHFVFPESDYPDAEVVDLR